MEKKIVIIGGGVVGMSTAFHLANKGIRDITIIEKDLISTFSLTIPGAFLLDIFKPALFADVAVSISINSGCVGGINLLRKLIGDLSL